jgi:hypothetical protein
MINLRKAQITFLHPAVDTELRDRIRTSFQANPTASTFFPVDQDYPFRSLFFDGPCRTGMHTGWIVTMPAGDRGGSTLNFRILPQPNSFNPSPFYAEFDISPTFTGHFTPMALNAIFRTKGNTLCCHILPACSFLFKLF